jgi:hypothetical protein
MEIAAEASATVRGSSMTRDVNGHQSLEESCHFCRGCGAKLQVDFRGVYHKECLRADKRRRICAQRRREQERFKRWLVKQCCPHCGARYGEQRSEGNVETPCEASQPTQDRDLLPD